MLAAFLLGLTVAAAAPASVVAVGDDVVVGAGIAPGASDRGGGWVPVLADCLEEKARNVWTVRSLLRRGDTTAQTRHRVRSIREEDPAVIVLALGGPESLSEDLDSTVVQAELGALIAELRTSAAPRVLLVGLLTVPREADPALRERVVEWNSGLRRIAEERSGVEWLDLAATVRVDDAALVGESGLTPQGHALVGAQICEAVVP